MPDAKSSRSTSAVRRPRDAASRAQPTPVMPAADDHHVEVRVGEAPQRVGAVEGPGDHGAEPRPMAATAVLRDEGPGGPVGPPTPFGDGPTRPGAHRYDPRRRPLERRRLQ